MKQPIVRIFLFILAIVLFSFSVKHTIADCFISFDKAGNLKMDTPERLSETSEKSWQVKTSKGNVAISRIDGYRILYNNNKQAPFVNLKVEQSAHASYGTDTLNIIENLKFINGSATMETKDIIELNYSGYKIYGLSRNSIESGNTLGIFAMFPGNDITVYFYFNNLKPGVRNFENLEDYKTQRNNFIQAYTVYLKACIHK